MSLQKCLEELPSLDKPLVQSRLVHLSNLEPEEMSAFIEAWAAMTTDRRRKAISMLVELAQDNVELDFNSLFRHTLDDDDEEVRVLSIAGLWECEERSLIDPLIRLMNDDSEETVRATAAQALGRFALLAETGKLLERDHGRIGDALLAVIDTDGETVEVHRRAIEAVAPMSLPRVSEVIQEAYEDGDPKLVGSALYAMGLNCDPKWLPILLQELENEDNEVRYEAVGAISEVGDEEVVPAARSPDPGLGPSGPGGGHQRSGGHRRPHRQDCPRTGHPEPRPQARGAGRGRPPVHGLRREPSGLPRPSLAR